VIPVLVGIAAVILPLVVIGLIFWAGVSALALAF
jgi:hypothetical protein